MLVRSMPPDRQSELTSTLTTLDPDNGKEEITTTNEAETLGSVRRDRRRREPR